MTTPKNPKLMSSAPASKSNRYINQEYHGVDYEYGYCDNLKSCVLLQNRIDTSLNNIPENLRPLVSDSGFSSHLEMLHYLKLNDI